MLKLMSLHEVHYSLKAFYIHQQFTYKTIITRYAFNVNLNS